ncbi:MAG: alpha/beta fold hydrolase [Gammaproteobacteria bacterium]
MATNHSEPESRPVELTAADGMSIVGRLFEADRPAQMTALVLPGIGVPQRAFRHLAAWLADHGVRCLTLDYRGIGESRTRPDATRTATLLTWARLDAVAALESAQTQWEEPVVVVAHSFGGQLIGLAEPFGQVRAAVLFASQIGLSRYWDGLDRLKVGLYWHVALPLACSIYESLPPWMGFGTRLPRGVAREWAKWGRSPEWFMSWEAGASAVFAAFDKPVLAFAIEDDSLAPPRAVRALLELMSSADVHRRDLAPADVGVDRIGHTGFLKPGHIETVWREALEFLRLHVAQQPVAPSRHPRGPAEAAG